MSYIGKKPVDFNDVTEAQTFNVTDGLTVTGEILAGTDSGDAFNANSKLRVQKADHAYLQIKSANNKQAGVLLGDTDDDFVGGMIYDNSTNHLQFNSGDAERMRIDSSGNVGIGTTSPASKLHIQDTGGSTVDAITLDWEHSTTTADIEQRIQWRFGDDVTGGSLLESGYVAMGKENQWNVGANRDSYLSFATTSNGAQGERARIDSSGNLLVGKTSSDFGVTAGFEFYAPADIQYVTSDDQVCLILNRLTSYGEILRFRKDGATVGQINSQASGGSGRLAVGQGDVGLWFLDNHDSIAPFTMTGNTSRDNAIDLGFSSIRFNDAYITNGVTTGSDQNEKQQIASLTDAEIAAAKRISNGFKTFKWNDAVEAKGDSARTHTGVIAQEVRTALEAEGLDAGDYAFFMSNTWWETQTEVPAVEAVEAQDAVLDDDGNIVTEAVEAVEAQDAYTRTDTYDTADEAPDGATERTRLGIRYPELLAFVGAATEQRLASLETLEARIEALENA